MPTNGRSAGSRRARPACSRGKHRPDFTPNQDAGDFVVIINAAKVRLTGDKLDGQGVHRHTGYPGGIRTTTAARLCRRGPSACLRRRCAGCCRRTGSDGGSFTKLKVYRGAEHPHAAQKPQQVEL